MTTVWLTGLPAAGKSTLAQALASALRSRGEAVLLLDGDVVRNTLCRDLGFDDASRAENVRRVSAVAVLAGQSGVTCVVALISPLRAHRGEARRQHEAAGLRFLEVHVSTPLETCMARDPKGLYARARRGEVAQVTGLDAPYEVPDQPALRVLGDWSIEFSVEQLKKLLSRDS